MYFQLKATELNAFLKWEIGVKLEFGSRQAIK